MATTRKTNLMDQGKKMVDDATKYVKKNQDTVLLVLGILFVWYLFRNTLNTAFKSNNYTLHCKREGMNHSKRGSVNGSRKTKMLDEVLKFVGQRISNLEHRIKSMKI